MARPGSRQRLAGVEFRPSVAWIAAPVQREADAILRTAMEPALARDRSRHASVHEPPDAQGGGGGTIT